MINYNPNDKQKALELANNLDFLDVDVTSLTKENNYDHMKVCLTLFMDDNNGTWTVDGTYYGKYKLSYDGERICSIERALEDELDRFIEEIRNLDEREQHQEEEFRDFQNELWQNTNRNHF